MVFLSDDILYSVCAQSYYQRDFNTLFNCACSGKQLATIAVPYLYRMQDVTSMPSRSTMDGTRERIFIWTGLWRSIILSSLGKTLYPYCQYLRTLSIRDLKYLLTMSLFSATVSKDFFKGEMARFKVCDSSAFKRYGGLDVTQTISRIGEAITKQTPLLEVLIGEVPIGALSQWIPRLPRLTRLTPSNGAGIWSIGTLIRLHCPSFKTLDIFDLEDSNTDHRLAALINELRPQSLQSFDVFGGLGLGPKLFQALNFHNESLIELKLRTNLALKLSLLKECLNLVSFSLAGKGNVDLEKSVVWLKGCKKLRILSICFRHFTQSLSAAALMAPILLEKSINLTSLDYEGSLTLEAEKFYRALANQTSLQSLRLMSCENDSVILEDDVLVDSLSKLVNLSKLCLGPISRRFVDRHLVQLASSLPKLDRWATSGHRLTDAIWGEIASLRLLRYLEIHSSTRFTANGILAFIEQLGPNNKGLVLWVSNEATGRDISCIEQKLIDETIAKKVGGKFRFDFTSVSETGDLEEEFDETL